MARRPRSNTLDEWEVALVKSLQRDTDKNDQSILAYFTRPNRTVNHRLISQIRTGARFENVKAAPKKKLQDFLENFPLIDWATGLHLYGDELLIKSREAMLQAVQTFNNPKSFFRSELFIVSAVIAWTYLMHAYFKKEGVDYRHYRNEGGERRVVKTPEGAEKYWELTQCLRSDRCPLDSATIANLTFLIAIRHEIEHRMTSRIDNSLSAKLQACCINFNSYIKQLFGNQLGLDKELSFALQFAGLTSEQEKHMLTLTDVPEHVMLAQTKFEDGLEQAAYDDERYAVRFHLIQKTSNRKSKSDAVINVVPADSEEGQQANRVLLKEAEKTKWKPKMIVDLMKAEGFRSFTLHYHTKLWKELDAKAPQKAYGVQLSDGQWYWYENWIDRVREHCNENRERYS